MSVIMNYGSSCNFFPFLYTGGKGVKKAIKKVASGLVRDAERSWFTELSKVIFHFWIHTESDIYMLCKGPPYV